MTYRSFIISHLKIIAVMVLPLGCLSQKVKQGFTYKQITSSIAFDKSKSIPSVDLANFHDLTQDLPKNYVTDGSVDYTSYIQEGISKNRNVRFPDFPICINDSGLTVDSYSQLYFPSKSKLILRPSKKDRYEIIRLHGVTNVKLFNPKIIGDRKVHDGSSGEWGMGISIRGSANIEIYSPHIADCWGDGIYFGHLKNVQNNKIDVYNAFVDNCRRNGISITSGNQVLLESPFITNTNGTPPASGIVIEPSNINAEFDGIVINKAFTFNNYNSGIQIGGLEMLIGKAKSPINVQIRDHVDDGSKDGVFIGRILNPDKLPGPPLKGQIKIINPTWVNNNNSEFTKRKHYGRGPKIIFSSLKSEVKNLLLQNLKNDKDVNFQ